MDFGPVSPQNLEGRPDELKSWLKILGKCQPGNPKAANGL